MMRYKNTKVMVRSSGDDTDFFNTVAGNTFMLYMFLMCLEYILQISIGLIKNGLTLIKERNRWYPRQTLTDADYADDQVLFANTPPASWIPTI